jgi:crotonobetainyl-CoA:carnitine CoA-transferase CaiB-like acyl-CoA transferase
MKLEGIKVLDLSLFLPGPHLTMMMADHGATVVKIEPPGEGEPTRHIGLQQGGESIWFRNTHRGKRSVVLNLKEAPHREALLNACGDADVFVEAFRPGVMARLGLDYATLRLRNPGLIYCSLAAFGQTGPLRDKPAHDLAIQAMSGAVSLNLGNDGVPTNPNMPSADMAASLMAFGGICMALYNREKTGQGDYLDISMQDSLMAWMPNVMGPVFAQDRAPVVKQERSWGGNAFYRVYQTLDDRHLVLGGSELKFVAQLLQKLARMDLLPLAQQGPGPHQAPLIDFLRQTFAGFTLAQCAQLLDPLDICWAPVLDLKEAFDQPQVRARNMRWQDARGFDHLGVPIKYLQDPASPNPAVPALGEFTDEFLRQNTSSSI